MRELHTIAAEILDDWPKPYFGAVPYIHAMQFLFRMHDKYGADDASSIVAYFLSNASTWRGEVARRVKKELNQMLKEKRS